MKGYHIKDVSSEFVVKTPSTISGRTSPGSDRPILRKTSQLDELSYSVEVPMVFYLLQDRPGGMAQGNSWT